MAETLKQYSSRFDAQTLRERALIALSLLVAVAFLWWMYYADPVLGETDALERDNQRIAAEVDNTRALLAQVRQRIQSGVHQEKEAQLALLLRDLTELEERLRVTTIELIDPEKMFRLMSELVYAESRLKLLSLKRREVKPAIPPADPENVSEEPSIYRHVLEIAFSGSYFEILDYTQLLEALDWKLLWDEIELSSDEYPQVTVKLVISTLSTRKEWVGI